MRFRGRRRIDGAGFRIGCVRRDSIIATRGGFLSDAGKRAVVHRDVIRVARRAVAIERHDDRAGVQPRPHVRRHDAWIPGVRPVLERRVVDARR